MGLILLADVRFPFQLSVVERILALYMFGKVRCVYGVAESCKPIQSANACEKKKHKYQDCCVEVFCRDQMPRATTAADRALAPPLCCGCSLGLDRSPLGGRRRLDAAPRGHSGRASALVGEGVLQYSN